MNKISRKIEYALMALTHMSQKHQGDLTTAKEVAETFGAPFDVVSRVLQKLAQNEVLRAEQGVNGGYMIVKDLSRVSLHEVMEMVLGPLGIAKCLHDDSSCEMAAFCNISDPMQVLNQKLETFYQSVSIRELIEPTMTGRELSMHLQEQARARGEN